MATPPSPEPTSSLLPTTSPFNRATHTLSLVLLLASPLLIALPPRKLDLYTYSLAGAWVVSANHITYERTGVGILGNMGRRWESSVGDGLPTERAKAVQTQLRSERARILEQRDGGVGRAEGGGVMGADGGVALGVRKGEGGEEAKGVAGLARKLWMGREDEGWKEKRIREEREKLAEGRGYGGLIVDQIWEVWNWDKKGKGGEEGGGRDGGRRDDGKEGEEGER